MIIAIAILLIALAAAAIYSVAATDRIKIERTFAKAERAIKRGERILKQ